MESTNNADNSNGAEFIFLAMNTRYKVFIDLRKKTLNKQNKEESMHGCFEGKNVSISYFEEIVKVQPCKNVTPLMLPRAVRSGIICQGNATHTSQQ